MHKEESAIAYPEHLDTLGETNPAKGFDELYKRHYSRVLRHAAYLTGNIQAAEDIAQETFSRLLTSPPCHDNIGAWLARVASNLSYNHLRDRKLNKDKESDMELGEEDNVISIEDIVIRNSEIRLTRKILDGMNHRDRACLLLKFSGYKYNEIAEIAGIEKSSVGQILARAQVKFMEMYQKEAHSL